MTKKILKKIYLRLVESGLLYNNFVCRFGFSISRKLLNYINNYKNKKFEKKEFKKKEIKEQKLKTIDINRKNKEVKSCAIFASYNANGKIADYVSYYLSEIKKEVDSIIFVGDYYLKDINELNKINKYVDCYLFKRHKTYDFGSYSLGIQYLIENNKLNNLEELFLINDSCYGPVNGFSNVFSTMRKKECDFWGLLDSYDIKYHIQSFFYCFKKPIIQDKYFIDFFKRIENRISFDFAVYSLETQLTEYLSKKYKPEVYLHNFCDGTLAVFSGNHNATTWPLRLLKNGYPLVKVKTFNGGFESSLNEYEEDILKYIKNKNHLLFECINKNIKEDKANAHTKIIKFNSLKRKTRVFIDIESLLFDKQIIVNKNINYSANYIRKIYKHLVEKDKTIYIVNNGNIDKEVTKKILEIEDYKKYKEIISENELEELIVKTNKNTNIYITNNYEYKNHKVNTIVLNNTVETFVRLQSQLKILVFKNTLGIKTTDNHIKILMRRYSSIKENKSLLYEFGFQIVGPLYASFINELLCQVNKFESQYIYIPSKVFKNLLIKYLRNNNIYKSKFKIIDKKQYADFVSKNYTLIDFYEKVKQSKKQQKNKEIINIDFTRIINNNYNFSFGKYKKPKEILSKINYLDKKNQNNKNNSDILGGTTEYISLLNNSVLINMKSWMMLVSCYYYFGNTIDEEMFEDFDKYVNKLC